MSPDLFNITLASVMRKTLARAIGIKIRNDQQMIVAGYADGITI